MRWMKKVLTGAAIMAAVFAAGIAVRLLCSPFLPIEAEAPVFVYYRAGSMPEPVQVSPEDAGRIVEIITWNKIFCRSGTSDLAGVFDLDIGGRKFNGDENCSDFNDHINSLEVQITIGREELLQILLKYTGDYMEQG